MRRLTSKDFLTKCPDLFAYLQSPLYQADIEEGRGVNLYGPGKHRPDVFALMAKAFAAQGQAVQYVTVHSLLYFIEHDAEKRGQLAKVKHLFIDGFEKEFTKDHDCPYSFYQQSEIEEFLDGRRNADLLNNFSTAHRWPTMRWWSRDFIAANQEAVREIAA